MEHTGGLLQQMKDAKPFKRLSIDKIEDSCAEAMKELDNQKPNHYYLMGASQYEKFRLNPKKYFKDLINSVWC